ncbi:MAG: ABC transporter ATP-binding protein [Lautropia sp.]|nr:ABC transporter ATP-binding protein [Lautropia sp.]
MAFLRVSALDVPCPGRVFRWGRRKGASLSDIELMLEEGSLCTVFGPPGAGKSLLLRTLAGLHRPRRGQVVLDGVDVTHLPVGRRRISLVPALPVVYPALTVEENLAWPLRQQGLPSAQIHRQVTEMASLLGVLDVLKVRAGRLSPGTAQRVAIGRGLVREDLGLLLLDDALKVLDDEGRRRMVGCLRQVQRSRRMCILVSTQGQPDVMGLGEEWVMLDQGRVLQQGRAAEFVQYPRTLAVASRLGGSSLNVLPCRSENGEARFAGLPLLSPSPPQLDLWLAELQGQHPKSSIEMAIRAEHVVLGRPGQEGCIEVVLTRIEDDGTWMQLHAVLPGTEIPLCARVIVDSPAAYDLAVLAGGRVAGRRQSLQIINRHSLFFVNGRLVQ